MGGLVVPAVFERLPHDRARGDVRRARRHVPEPSRRPAAARQPARPAGPRRLRRRSTSGSRSTATPTACSSSTRPAAGCAARRRRRCSRRRDPAHPSGRDDPPQPDLLAGRPRGDPRARRRADPHQGRPLVHQAGDGRDRRRVRRRALGALLLRPQLPRRQRLDRLDGGARRAQPDGPATCRWCASRSSATPRAARSTPRSTTRRR